MDIIVKGIIRYPHIMSPSAPRGTDKLKYSADILIHKSDAQCAGIQKQINSTVANTHPAGAPKNFNYCWKDCAIEEPENEALKDYMFLRTATNADKSKPEVFEYKNNDLTIVQDPLIDQTLAGSVVAVYAGLACYDTAGNSGVNAYLNKACLTQEVGSLPVDILSTKASGASIFSEFFGVDLASGPSPNPPTSPSVPAPKPPSVPSVPPAPASGPQYVMTEKAAGVTRESFHANNWTDAMLVKEGYMLPPNGIPTSF